MEHSLRFNKVRDYFLRGLWSKVRVQKAVEKAWITAAEYHEITGEAF